MPATATRDRLADAERQVSDLRDQLAAARQARTDTRAAFERGDEDTSGPLFAAARTARDDLERIESELHAAETARADIVAVLGDDTTARVVHEPEQREPAGDPTDPRADVDRAFSGDTTRRLAAIATSSGRFGQVDVGEITTAQRMAAAIGTATVGGLIQPERRAFLEPVQRPLDVLDLIPAAPVGSNLVQYTQSTGINTGAQEVAEGDLKPELALTFADAEAPIRTIAGWLKLHRQTLDDAALLRAFADRQIRYAVRRRYNDQVIGGNGTGQNIRGLLNTTGVQTATVVAADNLADRLLKGRTAVELANLQPTAVVVNPLDVQKMLTLRENPDGTGGYLFGGPLAPLAAGAWGLRLVSSQAIAAGQALVGDFTQALALIRDGLRVLFSDSDQDDFVRNRVTMLGEMRGGLLVQRPDAFCRVNLGAVT